MTTEDVGAQSTVTCPRCGGTDVRTVEQALGGRGALTKQLGARPAKGPDKTGEGCMHFAEGLVMAIAFGGGLAYYGMEQDNPLYTVGGVVLGLLVLAGTIAIVRDDGREKSAEQVGAASADRLWLPARYCYGCEGVFCPGGDPWQGVLTPEQFKQLVWCEGGYANQLQPGDKARDAETPPDTLPVSVPPPDAP